MKNKILKKIIPGALVVAMSLMGLHLFKIVKENKEFKENNNISTNILNNTDFILGLKSVPQLEYAVGDSVVNVHENDGLYKTFKENNKYEIFIDKKSSEINSMHYMSSIKDINENDMKYLKNIYSLTFSNISTYMTEKTEETIRTMCDADYIANKNSSIVKNGSISESIIIGKTSEIKITIYYEYNGSRNEPTYIDLAILKGNKW